MCVSLLLSHSLFNISASISVTAHISFRRVDEIMGNVGTVNCLSNSPTATPVLSYFQSLQAANLAISVVLDFFYVDLTYFLICTGDLLLQISYGVANTVGVWAEHLAAQHNRTVLSCISLIWLLACLAASCAFIRLHTYLLASFSFWNP